MAAMTPTARVYVQLLLTLLHRSQAQIIYATLPKTVETLLQIPQDVRDTVTIRNVMKRTTNGANKSGKKVGELLYFGVGRGIEGISCGIDEVWKYVKDLSLINMLKPEMLTHPFKMFLERYENLESGFPAFFPAASTAQSSQDQQTKKEPVKVSLDLFADGFSPYKNCSRNYWGVYGLVTQLFTNAHGLYDLKDTGPFKIAVYQGDEKPNVDDLLDDIINELNELSVFDNNEESMLKAMNRGYYVKVRVVRGDGPARAMLKCVKGHNGYNSCERCLTIGKSMNEVLKRLEERLFGREAQEKRTTLNIRTAILKKNQILPRGPPVSRKRKLPQNPAEAEEVRVKAS